MTGRMNFHAIYNYSSQLREAKLRLWAKVGYFACTLLF
jgi:hypothetical protein